MELCIKYSVFIIILLFEKLYFAFLYLFVVCYWITSLSSHPMLCLNHWSFFDRQRLAMSVDRMPVCPALASEGFSSTPIKSSQKKDLRRLSEDGVVSEDEDTFSLLSPIYHDSYESSEEEELKLNHDEPTSPRLSDNSKLNVSSVRYLCSYD